MRIKGLKELSNKIQKIDALIVGGGIVGAGIFRDLSLNGAKCLIVEKDDFASKTSQWSSKMLHGGVRYLETYDFSLVREALLEKNLWLRIAPHLCYENKFYLPVYEDNKNPLWKINLGLWIYDLLSSFQNSPHQKLNKNQTLSQVNGLKEQGLTGCGIYYDAIVDDAKMTLESIYDGALEKDSYALNHCTYLKHENIGNRNKRNYLVHLKDNLTGEEISVETPNIIFALGPYTDLVLKNQNKNWSKKMLPSKGIHLWIKKDALPVEYPLLLPLKDGRVMFVIPQKGRILVGTTETKPKNLDDVEVYKEEIEYVKKSILDFFPNHPIKDELIVGSYAGIRPLVRDSESNNLGKTSREHKVYSISPGVYAIAGGKLTTYRIMGQKICEDIFSYIKLPYNPDLTAKPFRKTSIIPSFQKTELTEEKLKLIISTEFVRTKSDLLKGRLGCTNEDGYPFHKELPNFDIDKLFEDIE